MEVDTLLAQSYIEMSGTAAFRDLLARMDKWVEEAERDVTNLAPEQQAHYAAYFTKWQQRRELARNIRDHIEAMKVITKEQHERPSSTNGDPTDYYSDISASIHLAGY